MSVALLAQLHVKGQYHRLHMCILSAKHSQMWSNALKFTICETKWCWQAEGQALNPHGGHRNNSGCNKAFNWRSSRKREWEKSKEEFSLKKIYTSHGYKPNLKPARVLQVTAWEFREAGDKGRVWVACKTVPLIATTWQPLII